ncbi:MULTISPECIES: YlxM family DNA-binding protein [unclassified Fusobacterium]|uniref:YlxM family DNA-binding protein n=1 Tax=unclassified Fusobacterium TaxID=2648384 RepID=UPI0025C42D35|nr:sigma factor-like helix-turn-helix DNA-binding protein [Fusobacterium sp.]
MELDEFLEVSTLLDYYRNLLSDKQKEYLINHFEEDLSLSEIAKNNGVSRQAVYDNIKRGIKQLREYEEKLGFHKKEKKIYDELLGLRENFELERLDEIIERLF